MATIQYARLYPDTTQLQAKDGHNLTAGWVEVYLAGTDDPAITYADFNGTRNPQKIPVDDNGRFCAIVDKSKAYRVEVYDADGMLQWTTEPVWCTGNAGAGMSATRVVSTDGSIAVEESIDGSERTYDLSIAPSDSDEFLEWIKCSEEDCGSTWHPVYQAGTMETEAGQGIKVHVGQLYHFTNTFYVDPDGTGINYDTFKVTMYCNDEIVDVRDFDVDSSLNDSVMCEFSTDLIPEEDGVVYYKLTIPSTCEVTAEVQCHRIYSGINAVPGSCAAKPWVSEYFEEKSSMSAYIPYSGLEYNQGGRITGVSGSAIYAALDSSTVSAIASSYAESAISSISGWSGDFSSISSKIDWSSSGVFQPSGDYQTAGDYAYNSAVSSKVDQSAFEQCCDEVHSALDEKLDKSASSEFQPSGQYVYESAYSSFSSEVTNNISSISSTVSGVSADMSSYVPFSGIEGEGGHVTGISGSSIKGHEYTGLNPIVVDNTADTIAVEHRTLCVDSTMTAYNSGSSAVIGVNVAGLDISSKMDASASSLFYSTSNPSGFIDGASASAIASAYAESAASSKQDTLTFAYDADKISAINGSALAGQGGGGLVTAIGTSESGITSLNNSGLVDTAALHSADYSSLYVQEPLYISASGDSSYIGISGDIGGIDSATCSAIASAYAESAASGKLDTTAQVVTATASASSVDFGYTSYYMGGINGLNLSANKAVSATHADQANEALSATNWLGESSKLDSSASSSFYTTANESGYVDSAYVESQVSGKQDTLTFDWDADSAISSINGSALAGQGGGASITAVSYDTATQQSSIVTATGFGIVGSATNYPRISSVQLTDGQTRPIEANTLAPGAAQTASGSIAYTLQFSPASSMWTTADAATGIFSPLQYGTGAGLFMDSVKFKGYIKGNELFVCNTAIGRAARLEVHQSRGSRLGLTSNSGSATVNLKESELAIVNSAVSTATLGRTKLEFKSPVSGTGTYATNYINLYDMAESATKTISSTSIDYWNGKADSSALSSYALSADVSGTVDLVSSQSANWGGSALALSAGPGVKLEKVGNTLVASTDETVLWENTAGQLLAQGITFSESRLNFEMLRLYMASQTNKSVISYDMPMYGLNRSHAFAIQPSMPFMDTPGTGFAINWEIAMSATDTTMSSVQALFWGKNNFGSANSASGSWTQGANNGGVPVVYKVIGINRTAGV